MKQYKFKINGNEYNVAVKKVEGKIAEVNVNGVDYSVEMENAPAAAAVAAAATTSKTISRAVSDCLTYREGSALP